MNRIQKIKLALFYISLAATIIFAILFPRLTLPFGFAYIVYLVTKPLAVKLTTGSRRQKVFFSACMTIGICFMFFPLFATIYNAETDISHFTNQLPKIQKTLQDKFFVLKVAIFEKFGVKINVDPVNYVVAKIETYGTTLIEQLPNYLSSAVEWMLLEIGRAHV